LLDGAWQWRTTGVTTVDALGREAGPSARRLSTRGGSAFVLLAYLISWSWVIPFAAAGRPVKVGDGWPTHLPALVGPALAGLLVAGRVGGWAAAADLLSRAFRWRMRWRCWAAAASPLLVCLPVVLVLTLFGAAPPVADFAKYSGVSAGLGLLAVWVLVVVVNGIGEETGWRGFALPRLERRYGPLAGTVVLTLVWGAWHIPQFFLLDSFADFSLPMVPVWLYGLFSGAVVMTWLYNRSGGSILAVAVFHALYNLTGATQAAADHSGLLGVLMWAFVVAVAIGLLRAERRARHAGRPTVIGARP
jgi:uncharacterized protein